MAEHEAALIQIGSVAITSGAVVAVLKWFIPYIIELWFSKKHETIQAERSNTAMAVELEELRKKNAEQQIDHINQIVNLHSIQMSNLSGQFDDMKRALNHTDGELAKLLQYMPVLIRISKILEDIDKRGKPGPSGAAAPADPGPTKPAPPAVSEKVKIGQDAILIRDRKPGAK